MNKIKAFLSNLRSSYKTDLKQARSELQELSCQVKYEMAKRQTPIEQLVFLYRVADEFQLRGVIANLAEALARKNYGQINELAEAAQRLQTWLESFRRESGDKAINRAKPTEKVTAANIYLVDPIRRWAEVYSAEFILTHKNDLQGWQADRSYNNWDHLNKITAKNIIDDRNLRILEETSILMKVN
jgi:hypothetical protein